MIRKLASIQTIAALNPIAQADAIETATVLGWKLVVKKGEFQVGDECLYIEIDSMLPPRPEWEFLRKSCYNPRFDKFRIKTVKMRGQISQGICFPKSLFPELADAKVGDDVTERLGVEKYEPPLPAVGDALGVFPGFMPKTDEIRIQSAPDILTRHRGLPCVATVKLDGSSCTIYFNQNHFGVCSRNLELKPGENKFWGAAEKYNLPVKLPALDKNIALQGELVGEGINGNRQALKNYDWYVFSGYWIDEGRYLNADELESVCQTLGLKQVPVVARFTLNHSIEDLIELSKGSCLLNDCLREGVVVRAETETYDPELGRVSFKVINPEYLLKYGD